MRDLAQGCLAVAQLDRSTAAEKVEQLGCCRVGSAGCWSTNLPGVTLDGFTFMLMTVNRTSIRPLVQDVSADGGVIRDGAFECAAIEGAVVASHSCLGAAQLCASRPSSRAPGKVENSNER